MNDYARPTDSFTDWNRAIAETEMALVGGIILNPAAISTVTITGLNESHFGDLACAALWKRITDVVARGGAVDYRSVVQGGAAAIMGEGGSLDHFIATITSLAAPGSMMAEYAGIVRSAWVVRQFLGAADGARADLATNDVISLARRLIEASDDLRDAALDKSRSNRGSLSDIAEQVGREAEAMMKGELKRPPSTGIEDLDRHLPMRGLAPGALYVLAGRTGQGKAQPLTSLVRSPGGWVQMGALHVGDEICSRTGEHSGVTGIFPQGVKPVFRVTMSDGRSTRVCGDHLWEVHSAKWMAPKIISTDQIAAYLRKPSYRGRLTIPVHSGDVGQSRKLPIDPWLLGALIGNGCFRNNSITFSSSDPETVERVRTSLPTGHEIQYINRYDYRIKGRNGGMALACALSELGLRERLSAEKHIPRQYLDSDSRSRLELLRGLMDTDGWIEQDGAALYQTSSPALGRDVVELARSLGFWARIRVREAFITEADGSRSRKLDAYTIAITGPHIRDVVTLPRKTERLATRSWNRALTIASIEPDGEEECQCISVSSSDSLYLTDEYIVTHNTMMGAALASKMSRRGDGAAYFSLEVPSKEIAARVICERLGGKGPVYGDILAGHANDHDLETYIWAAQEARKEPLHLDDTPAMTMADILVESRKFGDRLDKQGKKLRLAIVDHAMLVRPTGRYQGNKVNELGEIANSAKVMAKTLDCTVMLCCQLARAVEQRDDKRPNLSDLRASGEIEEAADAVLMLYREHYYATRTEAYRRGDTGAEEMAEAVKNDLEIGVEKSRQGKTGRVPLWCDPGRSIVAGRFGGSR